ncbi:MAG TPA: AMP-binding protein [Acidobacteriota bacterium]|nr:AMP-binding protein [Acidobacteriota bacterium]
MGTITEYLSGKSLFITGATGFLGQALVEKILWSAPDVRRMYLLIRPKKQLRGTLSAQQRIEKELFQSSAFDRLYSRHGDNIDSFLKDKLRAVTGDISEDNLGIEKALLRKLRSQVDIVINSAAVVSFDAPLNEALELNVFGAVRLAHFAQSCRKAVLLHVSTAYVCGNTDRDVPETLHHSAFQSSDEFPQRGFRDLDHEVSTIRQRVENIREQSQSREVGRELMRELIERNRKRGRKSPTGRRREIVERLRRSWLRDKLVEDGMNWARQRGWNDTYTYTKALGEQMVMRERGDLPTAVVRPSVIESSLSEPSPGWLDGLRMADPLIAAIGKGRLKTLPLNPEAVLDIIPADMVVNAMLAILTTLEGNPSEVGIYQVATGSENPICLGTLYELIYAFFESNPMLDRDGRPISLKRLKYQTPERFRLRHKLRNVPLKRAEKTLDLLPVFDVVAKKYKRRIAATRIANEKLYYYGEIYEPYLNLDCRFQVSNTQNLYNALPEEEKVEFNFDVTRLNWRYYVQNVHIPGVKKFILKVEGGGSLEVADPREFEPLKEQTIPYLLERAAERYPDRPMLQIKRGDEWEQFSYREVLEQSREIARRFQRLGLSKGDRVVLFSENLPEWGIAYLAAVSIGLVVVPIDAQTWHREAWSVARFTGARAFLVSELCFKRLRNDGFEENEKGSQPVKLLNINNGCRPFGLEDFPNSTVWQEGGPELEQEVQVKPGDPASIIFTSGTVANPRGALHTHANFINNLLGVNHFLPIYDSDQLLCILPLYHAFAFSCGFLMPIYGGATISYAHSLKPRVLLEAMRETGTTCLLGVPTFLAMLRDDIERRILKTSKSKVKSSWVATSKQLSRSFKKRFGRNIGKALFSRIHQEFGGNIRIVVSGGSALGGELYDDYHAMGFPIYEGYGLTETAPVLTVSPLKRSRRESAGKPLPGVELRLFHPDEEGVGEIIVKTPSLMEGYYKNEPATRDVIRDKWFYTGDLGWVDNDGYVYITGRIKDVIVTGAGKNVYPIDLEAIYRSLSTIDDICVVGMKTGLTEEVHAVVVPHEEINEDTDRAGLKREIQLEISRLARELPSYHRLQALHLHPGDLPCQDDGEVDRKAVRAWLNRKLEGETIAARAVGREEDEQSSGSDRELIFEELSRLSGVPLQEVSATSDLYTDLGLDSLMAIELLLYLEHRFGVSIPDQQAASIHTVGEVLAQVETLRPKKTRRSASDMVRSALPLSQRPLMDRIWLGMTISSISLIYRFYLDLELHNTHNLPDDKPYILAPNHSSHLDIGAILSAFKRARGVRHAKRLHSVGARDYFFDNGFKSWFFSSFLNVVPIEREEASLAGLRLVKSILETGEPILIFPEGTRTMTGELQGFKPGLGLMALELDVPIIPVYIKGTYKAMPKGSFFPRPGTIEVFFGEPISMNGYRDNGGRSSDTYRRIAADVRQAVQRLAQESSP